MIKKEYIQPTVKEIKVNLPVVLAADSLSGEGNTPDVNPDDPGFEDEGDI